MAGVEYGWKGNVNGKGFGGRPGSDADLLTFFQSFSDLEFLKVQACGKKKTFPMGIGPLVREIHFCGQGGPP